MPKHVGHMYQVLSINIFSSKSELTYKKLINFLRKTCSLALM
jgi:hypothetical protein